MVCLFAEWSFSGRNNLPKKGRVHMKVKLFLLQWILNRPEIHFWCSGRSYRFISWNQLEGITDKKDRLSHFVRAGSYHKLSGREDQPIAIKYLATGFHVFCASLQPGAGCISTGFYGNGPLAVSIVRKHADEWQVDPNRIIASGFQPGDMLPCGLGTFWNKEWLYKP